MRVSFRLLVALAALFPASAAYAAPTIWTFPVNGFPMFSTDYGATWTENKTAGASTTIRVYVGEKTAGGHRFISNESAPYKTYELQSGTFVDVRASTPLGTAAAWTEGATHANWTWVVRGDYAAYVSGYNFSNSAAISVSAFNSNHRYFAPNIDSSGFGYWQYLDISQSKGIYQVRRTQTNSPSGSFSFSSTAFSYPIGNEICAMDGVLSVKGNWIYAWKNSFVAGCGDTDIKRGVWRIKKDGTTTEQVFSIGTSATVPVGGSADICQSADGSTVMVVSNWPDRIMLSRKGNAAAGGLNDFSYTGPTRDFVACGVSPNGNDLYAVVSDGSVWASVYGSAWTEVAPAGTLPSAGSPRSYWIVAMGDSTAAPLAPATSTGSFVFGSGSLSGSGSVETVFGDLPPVSEAYDCSVMFDPDTRAFTYPTSESSFQVDTYIFQDSATILGASWSCPFLLESVDPCDGAYDAVSYIVDGIGSAFEYVFSGLVDPVFSLFDYMGTPESGGRYCFLGDSLVISGKHEDAPAGKTGYDYLILMVVTAWLLLSVIRR